jgi:hypothetical protein
MSRAQRARPERSILACSHETPYSGLSLSPSEQYYARPETSVASYPGVAMAYRIRTAYLSFTLAALAACSNSNAPKAAGPPVNISVSAGSGQHGATGSDLIAHIAVKVTDESGRGIPNVVVQFAVTAGTGTVSPPQTSTNGSGVAITSWRLGTRVNEESAVVAKLGAEVPVRRSPASDRQSNPS